MSARTWTAVVTAVFAFCLETSPTRAQSNQPAEPVEATSDEESTTLPTVEVVTTPEPAPEAKKAAAKKKAQPSATNSGTPESLSAQPSQTTGGPLGNPNPGGVDGYLATRTSTATKTDTPLIDIPQSITVVPKKLAKDQGSRDLKSALTYVPGVVVGQGEGHRDAPTIRGVSTTADFFVDGVRDDVQYFRDLYNIERIEVLKGPNAMTFGRGGGGGVINRVTKKAEGERIYEATTTFGSFDTKRTEIDAGEALTNDFAFRILGMYEDSGSYRDFTELERYGINPKIAFRPDEDTVVHLAYEYYNHDGTVDRGIPGSEVTGKPVKVDESTYFGNPDESLTYFNSHVATAIVEHEFDNGIKIKNHTQYGDYEKYYQNVTATGQANAAGTVTLGGYGNLTGRESIFNQTDLTAKVNVGGGIRHTLLAGTEFGYQETDNKRDPSSSTYPLPFVSVSDSVSSAVPPWGTTPGPVNHTELTLAGAYVQDQIEIGRHLEVIGGIRFDHFDLDYSNTDGDTLGRVDNVWSPRVGTVFKPLEYLSFYVSYSKSFLPFSGDQFAGLNTTTADLVPEEFLNREIGFKWDISRRLAFTGALFMLDRENQRFEVNGIVTQTGKTRTEGGELTLTGYVTDDWEVVAGYGYQTAEMLVGDDAGNEVPLVPHHTFSLWNKYYFLRDWAAGLGVISRTGMYANIDNAVRLPGYARLDAALFWDINENLEAQLNIENVLDTEYYATAHNNNNITPGAPRSAYVTITARY